MSCNSSTNTNTVFVNFHERIKLSALVSDGTNAGIPPCYVVSWLPGQNYIVCLITYGLEPCFDFKSPSRCQSVDGSCNNNRSAQTASSCDCRALWTYMGKQAQSYWKEEQEEEEEEEEDEEEEEAGISQGAALVVCPLIGTVRLRNQKTDNEVMKRHL